MADTLAHRFGASEAYSTKDHPFFGGVFKELFVYAAWEDLPIDVDDLVFVYSPRIFSRVERKITLARAIESPDARSSKSTTIVIDMVGVRFIHTFTANLFLPHTSISNYVEYSLYRSFFEADSCGFLSGVRTLEDFENVLQAPKRQLESEQPALLNKIGGISDQFANRSMLDILVKFRASMHHWLTTSPPYAIELRPLTQLIQRVIIRFTLGHELGHCIHKNRRGIGVGRIVVDTILSNIPSADPTTDTELYCDCLAIDYCLYHFVNSEKDEYHHKVIVAILTAVISLIDAISIGSRMQKDQPPNAREFYSGQKRYAYLMARLNEKPFLGKTSLRYAALTMRHDLNLIMLVIAGFLPEMFEVVRERCRTRQPCDSPDCWPDIEAFGP